MPAAPIRYPEVSQEIEGDSVSKSLGHVTYAPQDNRPIYLWHLFGQAQKL
jgi:hypothetical protein